MKISFYGASREVTGSCYLVETATTKILVDCGMFQGSAFAEEKNFHPFDFDPSSIKAVLVTHAHLDHTGRIPKLVKEKFQGKVYLTPPTAKIAALVLEDAEQIMDEAHRREGRPKLYEQSDIDTTLSFFTPLEYDHSVSIGNLSFRFRDAGHIFGSSFIEVEEHGGKRVTFSGDLGNRDVPILRPTERLNRCDAVIVESTYGNRIHEDESTREARLKAIIAATVERQGVLVIPAFAVERTQQLLFELNHLVENRLIPPIDIYLDSPMAIKVTEVIEEFPQYYHDDTRKLIRSGDDPFQFPGLHITRTRDESKTINDAPRPKVIIAGAGMMNGGRILHHLVRYLSDERSTILIIGYQAQGTLGRRLYAGEKHVDVLGERVEVKATIASIGAYSAHADQKKILEWLDSGPSKPAHVYCTHGEEEAAAALATEIADELDIPANCPRFGETVEI